MIARVGWIGLWLACLSSQSLVGGVGDGTPPSARQLWERGQECLRQGQTEDAIRWYQRSLTADPRLMRNHLGLAAAYLERGEEAKACPHLARFVAAEPAELMVRLHYAELLLELKRPGEARTQFERFDADAQAQGESALTHLIHCHSQLMEIAEAAEDDYAEHLHRGIGLFLLARERADLPDPDGQLSTEGLLCKAAGELALARMVRPEEARPCWYLSRVWSNLAQRQPAQRWLREADAAAPFSYLTPTEEHDLQVACLHRDHQLPRK